MPDIMRDYHIWWLDFWTAHPVLFWVAVAVFAVGLPAARRYFR